MSGSEGAREKRVGVAEKRKRIDDGLGLESGVVGMNRRNTGKTR